MKAITTQLRSMYRALARSVWVGAAVGICAATFLPAQTTRTPIPERDDVALAAFARVPNSARSRMNPFEGNLQEIVAGGKLFARHCAQCHGEKAGGTRRGPSLLQGEVQQASPGTLFWVMTNGFVRQGMPVWSKLPEPQRWQIVTFLHSLNFYGQQPDQK